MLLLLLLLLVTQMEQVMRTISRGKLYLVYLALVQVQVRVQVRILKVRVQAMWGKVTSTPMTRILKPTRAMTLWVS
jgi:hypothetical protein